MKKLICKVQTFDDNYNFHFMILESNFLSKVNEENYYNLIIKKEDIDNLNSDSKEIIATKEFFKDNKLNKTSIDLYIDSPIVFNETLSLPILTGSSLKAGIKQEISKLYPNYQNDFEYNYCTHNISKNNMEVYFLMVKDSIYQKILKVFKYLDLNIKTSIVYEYLLYKNISYSHHINKKELNIILNIDEKSSFIYGFLNGHCLLKFNFEKGYSLFKDDVNFFDIDTLNENVKSKEDVKAYLDNIQSALNKTINYATIKKIDIKNTKLLITINTNTSNSDVYDFLAEYLPYSFEYQNVNYEQVLKGYNKTYLSQFGSGFELLGKKVKK